MEAAVSSVRGAVENFLLVHQSFRRTTAAHIYEDRTVLADEPSPEFVDADPDLYSLPDDMGDQS